MQILTLGYSVQEGYDIIKKHYNIESTKDLSKGQAIKLIQVLEEKIKERELV